jgi:membrane-bound serine protease (ClpP class)
LLRRLAITLLTAAAALAVAPAWAGATSAATTPTATVPPVDVIQVSGLIDPVEVTFIRHSIDAAVARPAQALVIQLNTKGSVVSREVLADLANRIANAPIPTGIWVGPSGATAYGPAGQLLGVAAVTALAPKSRFGKIGEPLPGVTADFGTAAATLRTGTVGFADAKTLGAVRLGPDGRDGLTLGDFVIGMNGLVWKGHTVHVSEVENTANGPRQRVIADTRSYKLPLLDQLMHTVASPPVAFLLLSIGMLLLVFEFFTAGVGVAGLTGVGCLILAFYGVAALPHRQWALVLLLASALAFAVDVQTGVPRLWTGVGFVFYVVGAARLWDGVSMSWIALGTGIIATALAVGTGMPSMVRTRFATPTIGRSSMIGETGEAVTSVSPEGFVLVRGAQWRGSTNRATPINAGDSLRVVGIDGTVLEVEPITGGARDYRERR